MAKLDLKAESLRYKKEVSEIVNSFNATKKSCED